MSRTIVKHDAAYNLPIDTVYYLESKWDIALNTFMKLNEQKIAQILNLQEDAFFPFQFKYVSRYQLEKNELESLIVLKHPDLDLSVLGDVRRQYTASAMNATKVYAENLAEKKASDSFRVSLIARLVPKGGTETNQYRFWVEDLEGRTEASILDAIKRFGVGLNRNNRCYLQGVVPLEVPSKRWFQKGTFSSLKEDTPTRECKERKLDDACEEIKSSCSINEWEESSLEMKTLNDSRLDSEFELRQLALRIRDELALLQRENGINILIETLGQDFLDSLKILPKAVPSPLQVDEDFRIWLPNYKMEVKMNALSKTLYLLFLLYPRGVRIKELSYYKRELLEIYKLVSTREDVQGIEQSINELINVESNSVNEKMSRMRAAFFKNLSTDLAQHYLPQGARGEAKYIVLSRENIEIPTCIMQIRDRRRAQ